MTPEDAKIQADLERLAAEVERGGPVARNSPHRPAPKAAPKAAPKFGLRLDRWLLPLQILAVPWLQEIIDQLFFQGQWNLPLHPRSPDGLLGIPLSAFSHADFAHLIGNSIAFAIFSWLILLKDRRDFWITFCIGWIGGGAVNWLLAPQSVHGLSGVVYTLFGYLLVIGWLERRIVPLLISVFVLLNYSATLWGVMPSDPMVAWWGHLFGFMLGIFAAYGVHRESSPKVPRA